MSKAHWIAAAIKKPASFSASAKRAGESTAEYAEEKEDASGRLGRRARLAEILMKLRTK
jgi:hypothetical protein